MTLPVARRKLLALAALSAVPAAAEVPPPDPTEIIPLWPKGPPGRHAVRLEDRVTDRIAASGFQDRYADRIGTPLLTVFRPERPNGAAALIAPGGGYVRVVIDKEGFELARRLAAAGVTAFVLRYRLPGEGWTAGADVPLQDAQRALAIIRARAGAFRIDPARVLAAGFSAGGHLMASLATASEGPRPDLSALIYPVIHMGGPYAHAGSRRMLLGEAPTPDREAAYSPDRRVTPATPPTFLAHAADDDSVPLENSLAYLAALRAAKVPAELHVFEEGGHGFGIRLAAGKPAAAWPDLLLAWLKRRRFV